MTTDHTGKITVITGAGGGIGRAIAEQLARKKMYLVLLGGNNQTKLEATRQTVEQYTQCLVLPGDLTDLDFQQQAISKIIAQYGKIDILINNAGMTQNAAFEQVKAEDFDKIMAINVRAPFFLTQQILPWLKKSSAATVINICSVVAHSGYPAQSAYSASKHALLGWTKSLAAECFRDNVRVHAISPGGVYTDMVKISRPDLSPEGMIMPEDIADIVSFILDHRTNAVIDEIMIHRTGKEPFMV